MKLDLKFQENAQKLDLRFGQYQDLTDGGYERGFAEGETVGYAKGYSDGETKGMCITIKGLEENGFLTRKYENWEGYIVIEEGTNKKFNYSLF